MQCGEEANELGIAGDGGRNGLPQKSIESMSKTVKEWELRGSERMRALNEKVKGLLFCC